MTTRAKIATLSITALILCGIFSFVAFYKIDPVLLAEFSQELHNKNIIEGYEKKAHAGDPQAMLNLALAYEKGKLVPKNDALVTSWRKKAVEALEKKANEGDLETIFYLGLAYQEGKIVEKNDETAFEWYQKGAEAGHAPSQNNLGVAYISGKGTEKDIEKAIYWLQEAAKKNLQKAQSRLCDLYHRGKDVPKNVYKAFEFCLASAKNKSTRDARLVGLMYLNGQGTKTDKVEAAKWFTIASEQQDVQSTYNLAMLYEAGEGVEKDLSKAFQLYKNAAERRYFPAHLPLAYMYEKGNSPEHYFAAGKLFKYLASHKKNPYGQEAKQHLEELALACRKIRGDDLPHKDKVAPCLIAGTASDPHGQFIVGYLYHLGKVVNQDKSTAMEWLLLSAQKGSLLGQTLLAKLYHDRNSSQIDLLEAYAWSILAHEQLPRNAWEATALEINHHIVLVLLEENLNSVQKEQALKRAEEYRKKYETQKTPP
ncbi:MAG: SEL1-like repeat protein [Alphaproteobacteria bacterium]|nr:SEL1-like repeat protein [Alphaproteobacteria bacterium]